LHNNFYTQVSRQKRQPTVGDDLPEVAVPSSVDQPEQTWDLASMDWEQVDERLKAAIEELPVHYREVLLLWAIEGLKYREWAEVLDIALGTVMSRLYRARAILSARLTDMAGEAGIGHDDPGA
jgi:RNA polymerase sigma-70 factor (ECF subfamily)